MTDSLDKVPNVQDVMFVGDYFTLITSVTLEEKLRLDSETDDDFAVRLASMWLGEYYGWDVLGASNEVGIVEKG